MAKCLEPAGQKAAVGIVRTKEISEGEEGRGEERSEHCKETMENPEQPTVWKMKFT